MSAQTLPGANVTAQWYQDDFPGAVMDANCGVAHTTETTDWPGYQGGATAPNTTWKPMIGTKGLAVRQHFPIDRSSRALQNRPGGVETNTLNVFQVELIGTCDPTKAKHWGKLKAGVDYIYWPDAPDWLLRLVAHKLVWLQLHAGIPATSPVRGRWKAYPASYGLDNPNRLNAKQWRALSGWVGHQHVPENDHGDPGALDFPAIAAHAAELLKPTPAPKPKPIHVVDVSEEDPMVLYRTPQAPEAYQVSGKFLVYCTGTRAKAARDAGVDVRIVTVAKSDPLWKLEKVGA